MYIVWSNAFNCIYSIYFYSYLRESLNSTLCVLNFLFIQNILYCTLFVCLYMFLKPLHSRWSTDVNKIKFPISWKSVLDLYVGHWNLTTNELHYLKQNAKDCFRSIFDCKFNSVNNIMMRLRVSFLSKSSRTNVQYMTIKTRLQSIHWRLYHCVYSKLTGHKIVA